MADRTTIEWTETTWNPVRGCTKVSPGCKHCYAETFAERFRGVDGSAYEQGFDPVLVPEMLLNPFEWNGPRLVFVNSMSDLFQYAVPDDFAEAVARVMLMTKWHTYQVLTKRAARMCALLSGKLRDAARANHIWWGVSVEDKKHGFPRIRHLQDSPVKVRFLSIEPLLEDLGELPLKGIHWVIVGGESGLGARPMKPEWVRSIRDQCLHAKVPFFFKQWGGFHKKKTGRILDGCTHDDAPPRSSYAMPPRGEQYQMANAILRQFEDCAFELRDPRLENLNAREKQISSPEIALS